MLQRLTFNGKLGIQSSFVFTWYLYHEVFGCFTQPFRKLHESFDPLQLLGGFDVDTSLVSPAPFHRHGNLIDGF
jgi:hypothetical protein